VEDGNLDDSSQKAQTPRYKILERLMCSVIKTTNATVCVTWESGQERKPEEFSFQGKTIYIFFCFFHVVSV